MPKKRDNKKPNPKKPRKRISRKKANKTALHPVEAFGVPLSPNTTVVNSIPGMPKMSDQLEAFVEPYLSLIDSHEGFKKLLMVGMVAWNMALVPAGERPGLVAPLLEIFGGKDTPESQVFLEHINDLVRRKETDPRFAKDPRHILNFILTETPKGGRLEVLSAVPT